LNGPVEISLKAKNQNKIGPVKVDSLKFYEFRDRWCFYV